MGEVRLVVVSGEVVGIEVNGEVPDELVAIVDGWVRELTGVILPIDYMGGRCGVRVFKAEGS